MAVASQSAIPGDALYPVKRAIENTQAGVRVSDDAKGETILNNASGRLDEVDELTQRDNPDAALVGSTLDTFSDQATQAADLLMTDFEQHGHESSIQALQEFTAQSMNVLGGLQQSIPTAAEGALLNAAQVLFTIDSAADQVCPDCGAGLTEIPPQLLASGDDKPEQPTQTLAGGALPGTGDPSAGNEHPINGGNGGKPSTLNPPASPVAIPSDAVEPEDVTDGVDGIDDLLPTAGTNTNGGGVGGNGNGGKHKPPVDLTPVTETVTNTVNDVVNGVVAGVNGVLDGLSGK